MTLEHIDSRLRTWSLAHAAAERFWPVLIPSMTLRRAGYHEAFPHLLMSSSVAADPLATAHAFHASGYDLSPAVCYHAYAALENQTLSQGEIFAARGRCFRNEDPAQLQPGRRQISLKSNPMNTTSMTSPVSAANTRPNNFTRRTENLTRKFWRNGQWHLIPLHHLLRLSDLAREGIERSGSYRFADHLYKNKASGRLWIGKLLDRIVLNMRAAKGMRARCAEASTQIERALDSSQGTFKLLAIPCGIPRDLTQLLARRPELAGRIAYTAMDVDQEVVNAAMDHVRLEATVLLKKAEWIHGNALVDLDYPVQPVDFAVSTGLGEFLDEAPLKQFYENVFVSLKPGGYFFTSATCREGGSDYLLKAFEMEARYRTMEDMRRLFAGLPWSSVEFTQDATGLQTFVLARKAEE